MLTRLRELVEANQDFAFETTMASRSFAPFLRDCIAKGYTAHLLFVWLNSPDLAIERVAHRVAAGAHHIPDEVVRRRYVREIQSFLTLYAPIARTRDCMDNSFGESIFVAQKDENGTITVLGSDSWQKIRETL